MTPYFLHPNICGVFATSFFIGICLLLLTAAAKSLKSCPTLCDPIDGSPPGSLVPGILQARTLEWVAISFSSAWKRKVKMKLLSRPWLLATPWTAAYQAPRPWNFPGKSTGVGCHLPTDQLLILYLKGVIKFWPRKSHEIAHILLNK